MVYAAELIRAIDALEKMPPKIELEDGRLFVNNLEVPLSPKSAHLMVHLREAGMHAEASILQRALRVGGVTLRTTPFGFAVSLAWSDHVDHGFQARSLAHLDGVRAHYEGLLKTHEEQVAANKALDDAFLATLRQLLAEHGAGLEGDSGCCGDFWISLPSGGCLRIQDF